MIFSVAVNYLREFNLLSVTLRLTAAVIFGGIIGIERERRGHPAGFRTHMLVCLGAALAMLSNTFVTNQAGYGDPTRIAAQVISGIGFLGAGTILVTGQNRRQIKGLTTAAGLWASACIGIAIGAGFYEGAALALLLDMIIMIFIRKNFEKRYKVTNRFTIYAECAELRTVSVLMKELRSSGCEASIAEFGGIGSGNTGGVSVFLNVELPVKRLNEDDLIIKLHDVSGVLLIEKI